MKSIKCPKCGESAMMNSLGQVLAHTRAVRHEPERRSFYPIPVRTSAEPCDGATRGARPDKT